MWNPFASRANGAPMKFRSSKSRGNSGDGSTQSLHHHEIAEVDLIGKVAVATLTVTELSHDAGVEALVELLEEMSHTGAHSFVLDIQNVQHMDSACLGALVEAMNRTAEHGGRIALANTDRNVQYLFRMTRLDRVFPICTDVMAAINAVERTSAD